MMKVTRAPEMDDATRAALASGRVDPALGLFIDSLLDMRGLSDRDGEVVAGAALEAETPAALAPDALDRAMAAIERGGQPRRSAMKYPELEGLPHELAAAIRDAEAKRSWQVLGPGIRRIDLGVGGLSRTEVIRLDPGVAVPRHTHKGRELTLCLYGEYSDALGTYGPGDFSVTDGTVHHQPRAHAAGPAYALAVTDAGLRFEGLLGALQKLFRQ